MKQSARYGIVGSGWRSDFFLRLAALMPERFEVTGHDANCLADRALVHGHGA